MTFYKFHFSFSRDSFEYFFSNEGFCELFEYLIIHQHMNMILLRKTFNISALMLFHSLGNIACNSYVESSISSACKNVDISDFVHNFELLDPSFVRMTETRTSRSMLYFFSANTRWRTQLAHRYLRGQSHPRSPRRKHPHHRYRVSLVKVWHYLWVICGRTHHRSEILSRWRLFSPPCYGDTLRAHRYLWTMWLTHE